MSRSFEQLSAMVFRWRQPRVARLVADLETHQWWPEDQLSTYGDELARRVASYAALEVPYYRHLFRELGLDPRTMHFPTDWERLPVLTREILRSCFDDLKPDNESATAARKMSSGGSTGQPVSFMVSDLLFDVAEAFLIHCFTWCGWRQGEVCLGLWGGQGNYVPGTGGWRAWQRRLRGQVNLPVYAYDDRAIESWWQTMERFRPTVVYAYASVAADFARWVLARGLQPAGLKGIYCSAEPLLPEFRAVISRAFGCPVFDQYGCREAPGVSCECPAGNMHVFSGLNRVEFVGDPEGESSARHIVVTPLHNPAQPLLRYDLGDRGAAKPGRCPCGRGYPLMEMGVGRQGDFFRAPDGRKIFPTFFVRLLYGQDWIRHFQFRQSRPDQIDLLIVPAEETGIHERLDALAVELQPRLSVLTGPGVHLALRAVPAIERTTAGKHRFVINEMEQR